MQLEQATKTDALVGQAFAFAHEQIKRQQKQAHRSKLLLTVTALVLATLLGVYWQMNRDTHSFTDNAIANAKYSTETIRKESDHLSRIGSLGDYQLQARLAMAQASISSIRVRMMQFYQESRQWPTSFDDINIQHAQLYDTGDIVGVELNPQGELIILFSAEFGQNALMSLKPISVMSNTTVQWICTSNIEVTKEFQGSCKYDSDVSVASID